MATVSVLNVGDTFTAGDQNDIANQINQMHAYMTLANPNATSAASGGPTTWVTMGNVTVPTWASKAIVCLAMNGLIATATTSAATISVKIGTAAGAGQLIATGTQTASRVQAVVNDQLTSVPTGSQSVVVQATFVASTFQAPTTACTFNLIINWLA